MSCPYSQPLFLWDALHLCLRLQVVISILKVFLRELWTYFLFPNDFIARIMLEEFAAVLLQLSVQLPWRNDIRSSMNIASSCFLPVRRCGKWYLIILCHLDKFFASRMLISLNIQILFSFSFVLFIFSVPPSPVLFRPCVSPCLLCVLKLLVFWKKACPAVCLHFSRVLIRKSHTALLLAFWGGTSFLHFRLEAGGIHPF